jgi:hypothetical protein
LYSGFLMRIKFLHHFSRCAPEASARTGRSTPSGFEVIRLAAEPAVDAPRIANSGWRSSVFGASWRFQSSNKASALRPAQRSSDAPG